MKELPKHSIGAFWVLFSVLLLNGATGRVLLQKENGGGRSGGFLEDEIPLKVVSTTPEKLLTGGRVPVEGSQSLTVLFSRPVIDGSKDVPDKVPDELKPFVLVPEVKGTYRWLTTYIVTFEPAEDWASDLEVDFEWNAELEAFDGVPFTIGSSSVAQITTPAVDLRAVAVLSNITDFLTDDFWDAFVGTSFDFLPEVPPDASMQLLSSSPINLDVLQNSLFLVDPLTNGNPAVSITVKKCDLPEVPCPDCIVTPAEESDPVVEEEAKDPDYGETAIYGDTEEEEEAEVEEEETEEVVDQPVVLSGESSNCVNISFRSEQQGFQQGRRYSMVLPAETQYSNEAGTLKKDIRINFAGLRDFRIPFVEDKNFNISSPRLQLWLPHGLGEDVNVTDIPMKIERAKNGEDVDLDLELVTKCVVRVEANLSPGSTYRITAFESTTVTDGYGLKLKRSSLNFLAAPIEHAFGTMKVATDVPFAIFEEGGKWGRSIAVFSKGSALNDDSDCKKVGSNVDVWDVGKANSALPLFSSEPLTEPVADYLGLAAKTYKADRKDIAGDMGEIDISKLLRSSGTVVSAYCRNNVYHPLIICESKVQVVVIITSSVTTKGRVALVWVTDMKSAKPVSSASVVLYTAEKVRIVRSRKQGTVLLKGDKFSAASSGKTNSAGVGVLSADPNATELHATVTHSGKSIYVPRVQVQNGVLSSTSDSIILDRPIARPGETLFIKGYIMQSEAGDFLPANVKNVRLVISPSLTSSSKETDTIEVEKYYRDYGSYTHRLKIPLSVSGIRHTIRVVADARGGETYIGSPEYFTIVDARRAPAILTIDTPDWTPPNKKFKISAEVSSFAGAPIQNANLHFVWTIEDNARDVDDETLAGRVTSSTDSDGEATATIDLTQFKNAPSAGTVLEVTVHYTGASGERVEESRTIRLEPADIDITLQKTVSTDIPQQEFGVRASVKTLKGKKMTSGTINYALKAVPVRTDGRPTLKPSTTNKEAPGKAIAKCSKSLKSSDFCTFKLPKMGEYVLEGCLKVGKGKVICKRSYHGKTEEQWLDAPLQEHLPFGITPMSSGPYSVGQAATFLVDNPFRDVAVMLTWGTRDAVKTRTTTVATGRSTIKFTVDSVCSNNCALAITSAIPRQTKGIATGLENPVNKVFDVAMPHTEIYTTVIETKRKKSSLGIKLSLPGIKIDRGLPLIEPGINASVRVNIDRKTPVEITAFAIDKSILDLLPYPLKDVSEDFIADLSDYFGYKSTSENMVAPGAVNTISKANEARKKLDPWFKLISDIQPSEANLDIDLTEEEYLERYVQYLTVVPRSDEEMNAALLQSNEDSPTTERKTRTFSGKSDSPISGRPSYITPSLFESYTASGGVWLVNFEGPVQGGVFVIRAYASTGSGLFGMDEIEVSVKRKIDIFHDFPLFARMGDKFEAGITISTLRRATKPISVTVDISGNLKMSESDKLNIALGSKLEKEVRLNFRATGVGESVISIVADDGNGNRAKAKIGMTVYGPRPPVVIGSSFPVSALPGEDPSIELEIPSALEGSGSIVITAGKGFFPGVLLLADLIYSQDSFSCPVSSDFVVAIIAIPAIVDKYFPWSPDSNLLPKYYVNLIDTMIPKYQKALSTIYDESTSPSLGLQPQIPCTSGGIVIPGGVSLEQNAKGIYVLNQVEKRMKEHNLEEVYKNTAAALTSRKIWIKVLEEGLVEEASSARDNDGRISIETVAIARMALGSTWTPPKGTPSSIVGDLSMGRLKSGFSSLSLEGQAYYALAILGSKSRDKSEVRKVFSSWSARITSTGNRAYVTTGKNSATAESGLANSLVFLAFVKGGASKTVLTRMAYYVTSPISDVYGFTEYSIFGKTIAMLGLAEFDASVKRQKTDIRLEARSGTIVLLSESFTPGRTAISAESTPWKALDKNPRPIQVYPQGKGEVNVAIAMKFVPGDSLDSPVYKGIAISRVIQLDSAGPISEEVTQVPIGTVVNFKVQFMTPDDLDHTTIQVFLPAGLEPVQLGGEGDEYCPVPFFDFFSEDYYPSCPTQTTFNDKVEFSYESVSAGSHTVIFKAVAAISGSFGVPPARAFVTDNPSIAGMSSATRLDICASNKKCSVDTVSREFTPKECKKDCNANGACDLSKGKCVCFYGFGGDGCQKSGAA